MATITAKIFTGVLFLAIWLHSATLRANVGGLDIKNLAKDSVRLSLWYDGAHSLHNVVSGSYSDHEPTSYQPLPEELARALEKSLNQ